MGKRIPTYWSHHRKGDLMSIEIRDQTNAVIFSHRLNLRSREDVKSFLAVIEKFSGFSIYQIIKESLGKQEFF